MYLNIANKSTWRTIWHHCFLKKSTANKVEITQIINKSQHAYFRSFLVPIAEDSSCASTSELSVPNSLVECGLTVLECETGVDLQERPSKHHFSDLLRHHRQMNCRIKEWMRWGGVIYSTLPCSEQDQLQQVAQDSVQLGFEYAQGWRLHSFCGQPFPVSDHPENSGMKYIHWRA